jgi:hypothetical protein
VAAILKVFLLIPRPTITTRPRWCPSGGCARGFQRSGLKPPCGGSRGIDVCQRFLLAHSVPAAWGEPARPGFPTQGETGKGEIRLPCCRRQFELALRRSQKRRWLSMCLLYHSFLQITITNRYVDLSIRFPKVSSAPPTACRASIRTLNGPAMGSVQVGVRSKAPGPPLVMDLGCWVLPSRVRSLKNHRTLRSHPNKAVDVVPTKLLTRQKNSWVSSGSGSLPSE